MKLKDLKFSDYEFKFVYFELSFSFELEYVFYEFDYKHFELNYKLYEFNYQPYTPDYWEHELHFPDLMNTNRACKRDGKFDEGSYKSFINKGIKCCKKHNKIKGVKK